VRNGVFKRYNTLGYARASTVMSTQSSTGFKWSVKLFGSYFTVGIASKLNPDTSIYDDQEAIAFDGSGTTAYIRHGRNIVHSGLGKLDSGDVISFEFQPDIKKLIIDRVRNKKYSSIYFKIKLNKLRMDDTK